MLRIDDLKKKASIEKVALSLVFKELIQVNILDYLFRKGIFQYLVFQGGTALRLAYQGVRYSEDIDLVLKGRNDPFFARAREELESLPLHIRRAVPFVREARLDAQKETPTFKRYALVLASELFVALDRVNIEIAGVPAQTHQVVLFRHEFLSTSPAISVETREEILCDKFVALAAREYIKGRDLWDMHFLLGAGDIAVDAMMAEAVLRKAADYGIQEKDFLDSFAKRTRSLTGEGVEAIRTEMDRFLPQAYRDMYKNNYDSICRSLSSVCEKLLREMIP